MRIKTYGAKVKRITAALTVSFVSLSMVGLSQVASATPVLDQRALTTASVSDQEEIASKVQESFISEEAQNASIPQSDPLGVNGQGRQSVQTNTGQSNDEMEGQSPEAEPTLQDRPSLKSSALSITPFAGDYNWCASNASTSYFALNPTADGGNLARIYKYTLNAAATGWSPTTGTQITNNLTTTGNSINSLGVGSDGMAYFTNGSSGTTRVYQLDLSLSTTTAITNSFKQLGTISVTSYFTAGAVDPVSHDYYFGYYTTALTSGTTNSTMQWAVLLHLYRAKTDGTGTVEKVGILRSADNAIPNAMSNGQGGISLGGDFAFDSQGNMTFIASSGAITSGGYARPSRARTFSIQQSVIAGLSPATADVENKNVQTISAVVDFGSSPTNNVGGLAFTTTGNLVVQRATTHQIRISSSLALQAGSNFTGQANQKDLASCASPPTFQLQVNLPHGRALLGDQFILSAGVTNSGDTTSVTTTGSATGIQVDRVGPLLPTVGSTVTFSQANAPGTTADLDNNYLVSISCVNETDGATVLPTAVGSEWRIIIPANVSGVPAKVVCTFTNQDTVPRLAVTKTVGPQVSGETVQAGDILTYTLKFDNSAGTANATVDYTDYLADVLDDADLLDSSNNPITGSTNPAFTYTQGSGSNLSASWNSSAKKIQITGTVVGITPSGSPSNVATVSFKVKVKPNDTNALDRQAGVVANPTNPAQVGYQLNNFLVPTPTSGALPSFTCEPPLTSGATATTCTRNQILAWSIRKDSQPLDGTMVHSGANIYYRVSVNNLSGNAFNGIKIRDDLTDTLKSSVWDLSAPAAVTVPLGISFYKGLNGTGGLVDSSCATSLGVPASGQPSTYVPTPTWSAGKWAMETASFNLPACAKSAVVGYAIKVGFEASTSNATQRAVDATGAPVPAVPNAIWVNTVSGSTAQTTIGSTSITIEPNRCRTSGSIPPGNVPDYYDCKTWHQMGESYFHLWKQSTAPNPEEPGQVQDNLLGSEFVLADTEQQAKAGTYSRWLCRADNKVPNPTNINSLPSKNPGDAGQDTTPSTWSFESTQYGGVYWSIVEANKTRAQWNLENPTQTPKPMLDQCGLFYQHTGTEETGGDWDGQPVGSWHAQDIRGGDASGTNPLPNWRTASALNVPNDADQGRHGTYWIAEHKSPEDHQLLAQPFQLWVAPNAPTPDDMTIANPDWYNYQGRLSLPVVGVGETAPTTGDTGRPVQTDPALSIRSACVSPWVLPSNSQPNCVMPTGWTMPIFDVKLQPLPLAGDGVATRSLYVLGGAIALIGAVSGALIWRRRYRFAELGEGGAT